MSVVLLVIVSSICVAGLVVFRLRRRPFHLLDPAWAFLAGYFINYCVKPLLFLAAPEVGLWYENWLNPAAVVRAELPGALLFALAGLCGFAVGDCCFDRAAKRFSRILPETGLFEVAQSRAYSAIAVSFLVLGVLGLRGFINEAGWTGSLLQLMTGAQRGAFLDPDVIEGHGYYTLAMQVAIVGWALLCAKWSAFPEVRQGWRRTMRFIWRCGCMLVVVFIFVAFGERSAILLSLFIPFALYASLGPPPVRAKRKRSLRRWLPVLILAFIGVAGPIGLLMKQQEVSVPAVASMATSAWDSMEFTVAAKSNLRIKDLFWGQSYFEDMVYTWYPRSVFLRKPHRYGIVLVQDRLGPSLANFPGTFPTGVLVEAYANFWYVGLFAVPLLWAVICHGVYDRLQANSFFWTIQIALLSQQLASFRGLGSVLATLEANVFVVLCVLAACRLAAWFAVAPVKMRFSTPEH